MTRRRLEFGPFTLDAERGDLVRDDGPPSNIGQRAAALLLRLLRAEGRTVSKAELLDAAWPGAIVEESNLTVQIAHLRKALAGASGEESWIVTVPRIGYRFVGPAPVERPAAPSAPRRSDAERRPSIAVLPFT